MSTVLVLGDAIVDAVFAGIDGYPEHGAEIVAPRYELRAGGSAGYASLGFGALETSVETVAHVGDDILSTHWLSTLEAWGVDTRGVTRHADTSISVAAGFLFDDDRSFVTYRGASDAGSIPDLAPADYDAALLAGFAQAPYLWDDATVEAVRTVAEQDVPVYLDPNWSPEGWQSTFFDLLPLVDTLFVNDVEARRLGGHDDLADAGRALRDEGASSCVVTAGDRGCLLVEDEATWVETDSVETVDACGAGDFFNAGFITATLEGTDRRTAAATGNRCAREGITRFALESKLDAIAGVSVP